MTSILRRRLEQLAHRANGADRLIVVEVTDDRADDSRLVRAALAEAEVEQDDADLLVLLKRYGRKAGAAPCALVSVGAGTKGARR